MLSFLEIEDSMNITGDCRPRAGWEEMGRGGGKEDPAEILSVDGISVPIILEPRYYTDEPYVRAALRN